MWVMILGTNRVNRLLSRQKLYDKHHGVISLESDQPNPFRLSTTIDQDDFSSKVRQFINKPLDDDEVQSTSRKGRNAMRKSMIKIINAWKPNDVNSMQPHAEYHEMTGFNKRKVATDVRSYAMHLGLTPVFTATLSLRRP